MREAKFLMRLGGGMLGLGRRAVKMLFKQLKET
jgi:hypothetical protein